MLDDKILSLEKELELAEDYAISGPEEFNPEDMHRCLNNAKKLAKQQGKNISKEVKRIEQIWEDNCKVGNYLDELQKLASRRNINIKKETNALKTKFWHFSFAKED